MKKGMKIKLNKNEIENLFNEIENGHFKKSYKSRFMEQIDEKDKIISLQASYYFICYLSQESDNPKAKIRKGTIKNLFNKIFEEDFDSFYNAVESFRHEDLKGNISNSGGYYSLRRLENRIECETKLSNHLRKFPEIKIFSII